MQAATRPDPHSHFETIPDEELHRRYKESGDLDAYTHLFNKYWPRLLRFLNGRWHGAREIKLFAEDISNWALLDTLEKPPFTTPDEGQFCRLLHRVAANKAVDRLRGLGQPGGDDEPEEQDHDGAPRQDKEPPSSYAMDRVRDPWVATAVEDCKRRLPDRHLTILWMRIAEGMQLKEIGDLFEISHQRVSAILETALDNLRRCLEGKNIPVQLKGSSEHV
jgi:RNA polymerase sigma factor (sigma-70 family)